MTMELCTKPTPGAILNEGISTSIAAALWFFFHIPLHFPSLFVYLVHRLWVHKCRVFTSTNHRSSSMEKPSSVPYQFYLNAARFNQNKFNCVFFQMARRSSWIQDSSSSFFSPSSGNIITLVNLWQMVDLTYFNFTIIASSSRRVINSWNVLLLCRDEKWSYSENLFHFR